MLNLNGHLTNLPRAPREVTTPSAALSNERDFPKENETITFVNTSALPNDAAGDSDDEFWESIWAVVPDTELAPLHRS